MPINKTIDPTHLQEEDARLLNQLFQAYPQVGVFPKEIDPPMKLKIPSTSGNELVEYEIVLTHDIINRERASNKKESRYEVVSNNDPIGVGNYGTVCEIECTLAPQVDGSLLSKRHKERVVKIQLIGRSDKQIIYQEVGLTRQAGHLGVKDPAFIPGPEDDELVSYTVMKRLRGVSLMDLINNPNLTIEDRFDLSIRLIRALKEQVHARGIIHRDLKPENIMVDPETGEIFIFDYGLSKDAKIKDAKTFRGGTAEFVSPEVYKEEETDELSDAYSLAIILGMIWRAAPPRTIQIQPGASEREMREIFKKNYEAKVNFKFDNPESKIFDGIKPKELNEKYQSEIRGILLKMSDFEHDTRALLEEGLNAFEDIKFNYELHATTSMATHEIIAGQSAARKANEYLKALAQKTLGEIDLNEIKNIILENYPKTLRNEKYRPYATREYLSNLDIYALNKLSTTENFTGRISANLRDKSKISDYLDSVIKSYGETKTQAQTMLVIIQKYLDVFRFSESVNLDNASNIKTALGKVTNELTYWLSKLKQCPARLDDMIAITKRVQTEIPKLESELENIRTMNPVLQEKTTSSKSASFLKDEEERINEGRGPETVPDSFQSSPLVKRLFNTEEQKKEETPTSTMEEESTRKEVTTQKEGTRKQT